MIKDATLRILEFDKILATIGGFASSEATRLEIAAIRPLPERREIEQRLGQVEEIRRLAQLGVPLRIEPFQDITPVLDMVRPAGAVLDPRDLVVLLPVLRTLTAVSKQFAYRTDIPLLQDLAGHLRGFPSIFEPLEASIDEEGNILDGASRLLFELRTRKKGLNTRIRKRLEEIVRERETAIFLQDDFITQRSGRWVIPVRMDSKGMVPGVVHDVSNSGETAFMEPIEIIGLANELENLAADEKAEQIRILRQICQWIREELAELAGEYKVLVQLDLLNSIARFADLLAAEVPSISDRRGIRISGGRHPLLMLLQRERGGREVVPLDLALGVTSASGGSRIESLDDADFFVDHDGEESATQAYIDVRRGGDDEANTDIRNKSFRSATQVMVITGPNAGGKTIALKTTGLLLLMALSGIPVTASSTSSFPMLNSLLVDIGDEQSIEESLSTFSAHVARISAILGEADGHTLVLLDELGTGTEPGQGAAIACAVLHDLRESNSLVMATTHLSDIIGFVHRSDGMVNAAMEFDRQAMTPLYRLKSGEPGQSHALEIARRYGLPERVIAFAQGMVGRLEAEFHDLLAELKELGKRREEKLKELEEREVRLNDRETRVDARLAEAERSRRETLEKAWIEAKEAVQGAKREINAILDQARRERSKAAKQALESMERSVEDKLVGFHPEDQLSMGELKAGMTVFVRSIGYDAVITAIDENRGRLRVRSGRMEVDIQLSDAAPKKGRIPIPKGGNRKTVAEDLPARELKVIGLRVDDALAETEKFLNRVSMEGGGTARIVHGKGTGALSRALREYMEGHPLVADYRKGEPFEGGDGATVVTVR
jgi:DNA mismatch repair protein MutS2